MFLKNSVWLLLGKQAGIGEVKNNGSGETSRKVPRCFKIVDAGWGVGAAEETQTGIRTDSRARLTGLGNGLDVGCVRNRESRLLPEFGD